MRTLSLSLALILAAASAGAAAQAYRWVDENGKVHYGDRPPSSANASVRGTRSAKPRTGDPVTPGMSPAEVLDIFGKPDHVRKVATAAGEAQFWSYRRPKGQSSSYTVKIENGVVTEVSSEETQQSAASAPKPPAAPPSAPATAAAAGPDPSERQAQADAAARAKECASVRNRLRSSDDAARRGGSAQSMDRLREDRRRYDERLSELGC
jgi:pyruvate/2-oxoglutarate dehydrogenase complex dihydrolipoamide acyltransferase (E2) component